MCLQSGTECRKLLVRLQSSEALCGFLHGRRSPSQGHRGRPPSLHVAADAAHRAHGILHDVGACERAAKFLGQAESADGEDLVEALQNTRRHARSVVFQPTREIADQLLGLLRSSISQACRSTRRTAACNGFGNRSMMLLAL